MPGSKRHRRGGLLAAAALLGTTLACGGGDEGGTPTLTWYTNVDAGGQQALAEKCTEEADGAYRIEVSTLPRDANGQREQLVRRLAANDSGIDLMSLDVVFVAEFAEAGFLRPFTEDEAAAITEDVLDGPLETATWNDELVAAPFWANTQLLWYRRSVAERAGIDPEGGTVTWDQVIDAAEQTDTTVAVTGSRYEGYVVWINSLVASAGGELLTDVEAGREAQPGLDSDAGRTAAGIVNRLGNSPAAPPELDTAIEEDARLAFQADDGGFMVNWPFVYTAAQLDAEEGALPQEVFDDIAWARVPTAVEGEDSAPPLGGIDLGVSAFSDHPDEAVDAATCITSAESGVQYMLDEGNSGARAAVYDDPAVREKYPMADIIRESIDDAVPRPVSPFWTDVSSAIQRTWHPEQAVDPDSTPAAADDLILGVLNDEQLL